MKKFKVGSLIIRGETIAHESPDFGIVVEIKERKQADKYVTIYWFIQKKSVKYFDLDIQWFFTGKETSFWKIFN